MEACSIKVLSSSQNYLILDIMAGVMDNSPDRQPDFDRMGQYHQGIANEMRYIQNVPITYRDPSATVPDKIRTVAGCTDAPLLLINGHMMWPSINI